MLEGFVVDVDCVRVARRSDLVRRAAGHLRACALAAGFSAGAYALVEPGGTVHVLDHQATPLVLWALWRSTREAGVWVRAERHERDGRMETVRLTEVDPPPGGGTAGSPTTGTF